MPLWHADGANAEFVMLRTDIQVESKEIVTAVIFVTAEASPFCTLDPRLNPSDFSACIPHGGTSQPKLLGAYKLFVNGVLVGMGPGRLVNRTQPVDAVDVTSVVRAGALNAIGLEGYHS